MMIAAVCRTRRQRRKHGRVLRRTDNGQKCERWRIAPMSARMHPPYAYNVIKG